MFELRRYVAPDFSQEIFVNAPNARFEAVDRNGVAPENFHAMSIFPEYIKIDGKWLLAEESRMDCVAVYESGKIIVREFRLLKKGDMVLTGRTEGNKIINFTGDKSLIGTFADVKITSVGTFNMTGEAVK